MTNCSNCLKILTDWTVLDAVTFTASSLTRPDAFPSTLMASAVRLPTDAVSPSHNLKNVSELSKLSLNLQPMTNPSTLPESSIWKVKPLHREFPPFQNWFRAEERNGRLKPSSVWNPATLDRAACLGTNFTTTPINRNVCHSFTEAARYSN